MGNEMMQTLEIEKKALLERLHGGECDSLSTKVLSFKDNPLKLAMDRTKNEKIKKMLAIESKIKDLENRLKKTMNCNRNNRDDMEGNIKYFELENKYNILIKKLTIKNEEIEECNKQLLSAKKLYDRMKSLF